MKLTAQEWFLLIAVCFVTGERCIALSRMRYLKSRSKAVELDYGREVTLRYAIWSHAGILFCFTLFGCMTVLFFKQPNAKAPLILIAIPLLGLVLTSVFLMIRLKARVVIGLGKQLWYLNGYKSHEVIYHGQIESYYCNGYSFCIKKKDGNRLKVPATFSRSELVVAFLEDSARQYTRKEK